MKKVFFLLLLFIQFSHSQELALVKKDGKFGYISKDGTFKIEPKFSGAKNFCDGLAAAEENGKWGFINTSGTWAIPPTFENAKYFDSGICIVSKSKTWVYINKKGEVLDGAPASDKLFDFNDGVAFFRQNDKVGLINSKFEIILAPKYELIRAYKNGYAKVVYNKHWGIIDKTGKEVVETIYDEIGNFHKNTTWAKKGKEFGVVHQGNFIPIEGVSKIADFETSDLTYATKNRKIGFINLKGEWIINPEFDNAKGFSNNMAPICVNEKWGYVDKMGNIVISPKYSDAEIFSPDGLAPVKENGNWGFINDIGKMVIPAKYDISVALFGMFTNQEKGFINGLARVKQKGNWGFLKTNGELLSEWYQNAEPFQK